MFCRLFIAAAGPRQQYISSWTNKWQLRLNASKCGVFPISNKRKPLTYVYEINGVIISWISIVKYLGVYIQSNLSWSHH